MSALLRTVGLAILVWASSLKGCSDANDRALGGEQPKKVEAWPWQ